jgi:hypothetical protein
MIAGEKMPWLTVHITLPLILLGSMAIGYILQSIDWSFLRDGRGWTIIALIPVFLLSLFSVFGSLLGDTPPFQGKTLEQLSATSTFIIAIIMVCASGIGLFFLLRGFATSQITKLFTLAFITIFSILTIHTSFQASYQHYDLATEYLVYAHSGPGDKIALAQIEDLSKRLTGGLDMVVAYDNETTYPYWWYHEIIPNNDIMIKHPPVIYVKCLLSW